MEPAPNAIFWSSVSRPEFLNTYADMDTRTKLGKGKAQARHKRLGGAGPRLVQGELSFWAFWLFRNQTTRAIVTTEGC
jgi:hypothetical protein